LFKQRNQETLEIGWTKCSIDFALQMIQTSQEYESLESALPMFDLDADGFISAFEISRVASQAGVPEHTIPTLIRSLRMGPAGWVL